MNAILTGMRQKRFPIQIHPNRTGGMAFGTDCYRDFQPVMPAVHAITGGNVELRHGLLILNHFGAELIARLRTQRQRFIRAVQAHGDAAVRQRSAVDLNIMNGQTVACAKENHAARSSPIAAASNAWDRPKGFVFPIVCVPARPPAAPAWTPRQLLGSVSSDKSDHARISAPDNSFCSVAHSTCSIAIRHRLMMGHKMQQRARLPDPHRSLHTAKASQRRICHDVQLLHGLPGLYR